MNYFEYKNYVGSCNISVEDNCLHGKLEFISDLVTYEAATVDELKKEFEAAVESYLNLCEEKGITPKKTCKGSFNVRIGTELHQKALQAATKTGKSLNDYIKSIIEKETSLTA